MTSHDQRTIGGRYRLEQSIGQGGMGTVWRGHDDLLNRQVAVKEVRFPSELGAQEIDDLRQRTMREARATARLSHPNVVTTYDVVEEDDRPWIVMELLATKSLAELLREGGPLPPRRVAEIGLDVLGALETAHAAGVVHRDVKPSNVLVTKDGRAVLTDFGIATVAGDPALTSTGVVLGSPSYMSPERARGKAFGPESDLWSLGATLFAAAEGRPPFEADNALGVLTSVISDPVPAMTAGGALAEAITGLLRKDPAERIGVDRTRELLRRAAVEERTAATVPVAETAALERGGRTQAVPAGALRRGAPSPYDTTSEPDDRPRRGLLATGLAVALLVIAGLVALAAATSGGGDPRTGSASGSSSGAPTTRTTTTPSHSPSPSESSSAPSSTSPPPDNGAPAGYQLYRDPSGFSVAVPDGWQAEQSGASTVDIKDPSGGRFLRIDRTDKPKGDPKKDWEHQEKSVATRLPNYQRISIESVDYRGWPAADWEFTFGQGTHVMDRGFATDEHHGYAIYLSTAEDQWDASQEVFRTAAETFQPAGS